MDRVRNKQQATNQTINSSRSSSTNEHNNPSSAKNEKPSTNSPRSEPIASSAKHKNEEASSSNGTGTRFDWSVSDTKRLLVSIKENKEKFESAKNKNSVWSIIADNLGMADVTSHQCRERYYTVKKAYRKFVSEKNKTGNKTPKPFLYEELMSEIVIDDPTFTPVVTKGSLCTDQSECDADGSEESASGQPKKKKKTTVEELTEFFQERDEKFLQALTAMNEKQNKLMEKLIEKL